jgi:hypothetical protein
LGSSTSAKGRWRLAHLLAHCIPPGFESAHEALRLLLEELAALVEPFACNALRFGRQLLGAPREFAAALAEQLAVLLAGSRGEEQAVSPPRVAPNRNQRGAPLVPLPRSFAMVVASFLPHPLHEDVDTPPERRGDSDQLARAREPRQRRRHPGHAVRRLVDPLDDVPDALQLAVVSWVSALASSVSPRASPERGRAHARRPPGLHRCAGPRDAR